MSEVDNKVKMIVEGLLLAAGRPLSLDNIIAVFNDDDEKPDKKELKDVMAAISESCDDRGFELIEVASGYRFQVKQDISNWVARLWEDRPPRYTRALLETLALITYRQPITRGDIEEIRGVAVSPNIIRTLLDREWIRVVGHRDVPGRPAMFATTKQFLDYFNLKSLQDLPPLSEVKELTAAEKDIDLTEDLMNQRVLDLPEDAVDENAVELSDEEKAELLAEEEAIELAKKPLDEILNEDPARLQEKQDDDEDDADGASDEDGSDEIESDEDDSEESDSEDDDWEEDSELAETEALVDSFELSDHQPVVDDEGSGIEGEEEAGEEESSSESEDTPIALSDNAAVTSADEIADEIPEEDSESDKTASQ